MRARTYIDYACTHVARRVGPGTAGKGATARAESRCPHREWSAYVHRGWARTPDCRVNTRNTKEQSRRIGHGDTRGAAVTI